MDIGDLIREYRTKHGLSQRQFASLCGVSNGYISMLEKGINPNTSEPIIPSIPSFKMLASTMGISLHELFSLIDDTSVDMTIEETTLVHNYRKLDDIDKSKVEERIDTLLDSDKYKPKILPIAARGKGNTSPGVVEDSDALTKALAEDFPED